MTKRICSVEGCGKEARNKGVYKRQDGTLIRRYGHRCVKHHKQTYEGNDEVAIRFRIDNSKCSQCGWDKGPCDRHRIDPSLGYTTDNVKVLCPNCHRLEHINSGGRYKRVLIDD